MNSNLWILCVVISLLVVIYIVYYRRYHIDFVESRGSQRSGRGIVIAAGGRYLAPCMRNIANLRRLGCVLPITVVYADASEFDESKTEWIAHTSTTMNCKFVNASREFARYNPHLPPINFKGYQLKPFAILFATYRDCILFDADVICLRDPSYLFEHDMYTRTGTIFFPDVVDASYTEFLDPHFWHAIGLSSIPKDPLQQESSCVVMNTMVQFKSLLHTCSLNYQYKRTYRLVHGDKDTFRAGCLLAGKQYAFIPHAPGTLLSVPVRASKKNFLQWGPNREMLYIQGEDVRLNLRYDRYLEYPKYNRKVELIMGNIERDAKPLPPAIVQILSSIQ